MSGGQLMSGTRHKYFGADPNDVIVVGVDTVAKSVDEHPLYDDRVHEELSRSFIENLKRVGIRQPVECRREGEDVVVVLGRRRTLGLRLANAELVKEGKAPHELPVICEKGTSDLEALERLIAENEARKETSPVQKAKRLQQWFDENPSGTDDEAAIVFCTTATTIRNWKKLLLLDPKIVKAVQRGEISANAAADLSDMPKEDQVEKLRELKKKADESGDKKVSTAHTKTERKQRKGSVAATAYAPPKMASVRKIAESEELTKKLPDVVVSVLKYLSGLSDGSDLPELKEMVEATPARGKLRTGPKLSRVQQALLDAIDAAEDGAILLSDVKNRRPVDQLLKLGLVDRFEGEDGVLRVRRVSSDGSNGSSDGSNGVDHEEEGQAVLADIESLSASQWPSQLALLEEMPGKELSALCKSLGIEGYSKMKSEDRVSEILGVYCDQLSVPNWKRMKPASRSAAIEKALASRAEA